MANSVEAVETIERHPDGARTAPEKQTTALTSKPPPETADEVRTRRYIILSLWAIIAFFGLPAWYATTTVPRADLPLHDMNSWAEGQVCVDQHVMIQHQELTSNRHVH